MSTLTDFKEQLKAKLRKNGHSEWAYTEGYETSGYSTVVDWEQLNIQIDEFCAEFKAKKAMSKA